MATAVIMPKLGMTMEQGTVVQWHKQEGERVEKGEPLLEIATDKVNTDVESPASGVLQGVTTWPQTTVPVAQVIAYILEAGEPLPAPGTTAPATAAREPQHAAAAPAAAGEERVVASPLARRLADEVGLDLRSVRGSGPGGRIVEADVKAALAARPQVATTPAPAPAPAVIPPPVARPVVAPPPVLAVPGQLVPLTGKRKVIAERMAQSAQVPQFALGAEADMTRAEEARGEHSVTAFLVLVAAQALRKHPFVNASYRADGIQLHSDINIGVAVSAEDGLVVPVIKQADSKRLPEIDADIRDLAARARSGRLVLEDLSGGTFTISNLGMFGIEEFRALLNPPEACILAVGRSMPKPVAVDGTVAVRPMLHLVLSADHRVVDGATVAAFLVEIKNLLETPYALL
jgi:pyruvate dehydrogenase E2 component (dihydrolipoamide acetyltransferase)